jgi:hypothetical protein
MYGWFDHWSLRHAEELIEEAQRYSLARDLRYARRNEPPAGRRSAHDLVGWLVEVARGALAGKGVVEQPACEDCLAK